MGQTSSIESKVVSVVSVLCFLCFEAISPDLFLQAKLEFSLPPDETEIAPCAAIK